MSNRHGARLRCLGMLLYIAAAAYPQSQSSSHTGPLNIPWGTRIEAVKLRYDLSLVATTADGTRYGVETSTWEGIELRMCELEFIHGQLSGAFLIARGESNSRLLLERLRKELGPPAEMDPRGHQWFTHDVHITLDEEAGGDGYLYWYYIPLQHERGNPIPPVR